jgi:hypothetical protein
VGSCSEAVAGGSFPAGFVSVSVCVVVPPGVGAEGDGVVSPLRLRVDPVEGGGAGVDGSAKGRADGVGVGSCSEAVAGGSVEGSAGDGTAADGTAADGTAGDGAAEDGTDGTAEGGIVEDGTTDGDTIEDGNVEDGIEEDAAVDGIAGASSVMEGWFVVRARELVSMFGVEGGGGDGE